MPEETSAHPETNDAAADVLGEPFTAETIELPDDDEGAVVATLVWRKRAQAKDGPRRAVLYVHGFCDYFYQVDAANFWIEAGYDFYAVDLRKYGRSLRPHQTPNFARDLTEYYPELNEAYRRITERDGHTEVLVVGHSTGGLLTSLWLHDVKPDVSGLVLNAPWLDLQGSAAMRLLGTGLVDRLGARKPYLVIPRTVPGFYARALHKDYDGEWTFNLKWKPVDSFPVTAGWLRAIRRGHARIHGGLAIEVPILVLTSTASSAPKEWGPEVFSSDIVLDVTQMWRWAPGLGRHVTIAKIAGAIHDVTGSRLGARTAAYAAITAWLRAYQGADR